MTTTVIVDTGPLVALVNSRDKHHAWAKEQFAALRPPLSTCDAVVAEACYLLRKSKPGWRAILTMFARKLLSSTFRLQEQSESVARLMERYANVPMDFTDGCLVRLSELCDDPILLTIDDDFLVYRRHGRKRIPTIMPPR